jgi:hypothetical protein
MIHRIWSKFKISSSDFEFLTLFYLLKSTVGIKVMNVSIFDPLPILIDLTDTTIGT